MRTVVRQRKIPDEANEIGIKPENMNIVDPIILLDFTYIY